LQKAYLIGFLSEYTFAGIPLTELNYYVGNENQLLINAKIPVLNPAYIKISCRNYNKFRKESRL
jgi:hypothetical protein